MRPRTVAAALALLALTGGLVVFGLGGAASGATVTESWVSETPRDNEVNHHAVGAGPDGDVVVAPVAEVPHSDVPITDTSCSLTRLAPSDGSVVWRTGVPAADCFTHALTEPAVRDVDGDGGHEVVAATTENALVAYDARSGTEEWRVSLTTYGYGRPTVADVRQGAGPEVVASDIDGHVVVTHGNGTVAWRFDLNDTVWKDPLVWDAPAVVDAEGDGSPEVVVASSRGVAVLSADGRLEWLRNGSATYAAVAQADQDRALELFSAGTGVVRARDGASGAVEWQRELTNARLRTAADGDGDGSTEVYVGRGGGSVLAIDAATGETDWETSITSRDGATVPPPVLGDVNGDGRPEVVAPTDAGRVVVLDARSGAELATYERDVRVWTFATLSDLDDDGRAEVLVRYGDGRVVALDIG